MWEKSNLNKSIGGSGFMAQSSSETPCVKTRLIPVTVNEMVTSTQKGDVFVSVAGIELYMVSLLGLIKEVKKEGAWIDYVVDDRSGSTIIVKRFHDTEDEEEAVREAEASGLQMNKYVKVVGYVKSYKGDVFVNSIKMRPMASLNEIAYHLSEVQLTHKRLLQSPAAVALGGSSGAGGASAGTDTLYERIKTLFREHRNDENGLEVDHVIRALSGYPPAAVRAKIEFLASEGHIFAISDEEIYKWTS